MPWYHHPQHGYMFRAPAYSDGTQQVVTALCSDTADLQESADDWSAHKSRLRVNGGCGAIASDAIPEGDHNPEFVPVETSRVPVHIVRDFMALV